MYSRVKGIEIGERWLSFNQVDIGHVKMDSIYYLDVKTPHSEKNILLRFFFDLCGHFKQLLDISWNYKAENIVDHMSLLFFTGQVILKNEDPVFKQIWSLTVRHKKKHGTFDFSRTIPKESD